MTCAITNSLAAAANGPISGIVIKVACRATSLGTGLGAGIRRNARQSAKRPRAFVARCRRFRMLRATGVDTARLLCTGGNSSMIFGQRPSGVSDAVLLSQRRTSCAATCIGGCGADLDLSLMLADDKSKLAADSAFKAHVKVIHFWSSFWRTGCLSLFWKSWWLMLSGVWAGQNLGVRSCCRSCGHYCSSCLDRCFCSFVEDRSRLHH